MDEEFFLLLVILVGAQPQKLIDALDEKGGEVVAEFPRCEVYHGAGRTAVYLHALNVGLGVNNRIDC